MLNSRTHSYDPTSGYSKQLTRLVCITCSLGLFVDGYLLYISSIIEPFIQQTFHPSGGMLGLIQAAAPLGAGIGAIIFGRVCDKIGRKSMLIYNLLFFLLASLLSSLAWNAPSLCVFRFLIGMGVGMDYPICAAYIYEMTPKNKSNRYIAIAMFINCMAYPSVVLVAWVIFSITPSMVAWRFMLASSIIPILLALVMRLNIPESFIWQANKKYLASTTPSIPPMRKKPYHQLFSPKYLRLTIALSGAWFLMDIACYGIGLFIPMILTSLHLYTHGNFVTNTTDIIKSTLYINSFMVIGAAASIWMITKVKSVTLQKIGFIGSFVGLILISMSMTHNKEINLGLIYSGFILFNFFLNLGPDVTTYLLPAKSYPTSIRATGHGMAAGIAKICAFIGTLLLPLLTRKLGVHTTVFILSFSCIGGYLFTQLIPTPEMEDKINKINITALEL